MKIKAFVCYFLLLGCLSSAAACGGDDEGAPVPPPPAPPEDAGSGNMRVKTRGENLYIAAKMDGERDIVYWFKRCMFNELYTFYRVGIVRNTASEPIRDPSRTRNRTEPGFQRQYRPVRRFGVRLVRGEPQLQGGAEGPHGLQRTVSSVRANDRPVTGDVTLLADSVTVDVVNVILDPSRPLEDGELRDPLCRETVHYRIEGRNIEVSASHLFGNTAPVTIETYYGMQSMFANETQTFTSGAEPTPTGPCSPACRSSSRGIIPSSGGSSSGTLRPIKSSFLLPGGLGDHGMLGDGDIVFIGNSSAKSYHKLISRERFENGDRIAWRGVYTWFAATSGGRCGPVLLRRGGRRTPGAVPRCPGRLQPDAGAAFGARRAAVRSARRQRRPACGSLREERVATLGGRSRRVRAAFRREKTARRANDAYRRISGKRCGGIPFGDAAALFDVRACRVRGVR